MIYSDDTGCIIGLHEQAKIHLRTTPDPSLNATTAGGWATQHPNATQAEGAWKAKHHGKRHQSNSTDQHLRLPTPRQPKHLKAFCGSLAAASLFSFLCHGCGRTPTVTGSS